MYLTPTSAIGEIMAKMSHSESRQICLYEVLLKHDYYYYYYYNIMNNNNDNNYDAK